MNVFFKAIMALLTGFLNGFFGSGGGMIAVPILEKLELSAEEAHSTSILIILPLAMLSGFLYLRSDAFKITDTLPYIPGGIAGALFGGWLMSRLDAKYLRKIFGVVILIAAGRLMFK